MTHNRRSTDRSVKPTTDGPNSEELAAAHARGAAAFKELIEPLMDDVHPLIRIALTQGVTQGIDRESGEYLDYLRLFRAIESAYTSRACNWNEIAQAVTGPTWETLSEAQRTAATRSVSGKHLRQRQELTEREFKARLAGQAATKKAE